MTEIALALPGAEREVLGSHAGFKVKKKMFAYFVNDHHGDGIVGVWCKVLPGDNAALIAAIRSGFICRRMWGRGGGWGCGWMWGG